MEGGISPCMTDYNQYMGYADKYQLLQVQPVNRKRINVT
jgi:hypothetical protein